MEDMDPEPVPLLKGSFAERAGKFPITLVHTGGVFEMLISVILVGEYFSASFTFVTFCRLCQTEGLVSGLVSCSFPSFLLPPIKYLKILYYSIFKTYTNAKIIG